MNTLGIVAGMALVLSGLVAVIVVGWRSHVHSRGGALAYLTEADGSGPLGPAVLAEDAEQLRSFADRVLRPAARSLTARVRSLLPSSHLDRLHQQLLHAGLSTRVRAEEMAAIEVAGTGAGVVAAVILCVAAPGSIRVKAFMALVLVITCLLGPPAWLARRVRERTSAIERDLPDILDLLTIAVEAGLGLEQAMEAACSDFDCPMSEELARTLQEMSLGLSRQQALENLKHRSESTDLATFVTVLTQADVLGMPIGRVLRSQADEMRLRRRARAREKAAKLPVKILFPLLFFILPPLMILVIGPAVVSIARVFGL